MSDVVFHVFLNDCIDRSGFIDPDVWVTERIANMGDFDQETQQALFDYGLNRLLSMFDEDEKRGKTVDR